MDILLVSYPGGMFGEFTTNLIAADNKFHQAAVEVTHDHRYIYANQLSPIGMNLKVHPNDSCIYMTDAQVDALADAYGNKSIAVPTHWYNDTCEVHPAITKLRLSCDDPSHIAIAYCMGWIKSALASNYMFWHERREEVQQHISHEKKNHDILRQLMASGDYSTWKYHACIVDAVTARQPDLRKLIIYHFAFFETQNKSRYQNGWHHVDIGNTIFNHQTQYLDTLLGITCDTKAVDDYARNNLAMLLNKLAIEQSDLKSPARWLPALTRYCLAHA